jgi:hypothetical protein
MIVDYHYPALVKGRFGAWQRDRTIMVNMTEKADIRELGSSDVLVAANVFTGGGEVTYRYHDGELYRKAPADHRFEARSGLDMALISAISDACRRSAGPDTIPWPNQAVRHLRLADSVRASFRHMRGGSVFCVANREQMPNLNALSAYDQSDVDHWREVATSYVDRIIYVDGDLWFPAREPVLLEFDGVAEFVDASVFDLRFAGPKDQPSPFGRRERISNAIFWDMEYRLHSVLTVSDFFNGRRPRLISQNDWFHEPIIHLPYAFALDHAEKELDRVARVSVSELHAACKNDLDGAKNAPIELRRHMSGLRETLRSHKVNNGARLASQLDSLRRYILEQEDMSGPQLNGLKALSKTQIKLTKFRKLTNLMEVTVEAWANQEIHIDLSLAQGSNPQGLAL